MFCAVGRRLLLLVVGALFTVSAEGAVAARLIPLPPPPGEYDCDWLEWRIDGIESFRFLWHGCEDSGGEEFYRVDDHGRRETIVGIQSFMVGDNGMGQARFAKTLPLEDLSDDPMLWVSFEDGVAVVGNDDCFPLWQKRIPVILFGRYGDGRDRSSRTVQFKLMRLSEIVAQSRIVPLGAKPMLGLCDKICCHSIVEPSRPK